MYENAIEVLKKLNSNGFESYIVGGYPRNKYLGIESTDIDICTSATPKEVSQIFLNVDMSNSSYGAVKLIYNGYIYEITTFRYDEAMLDGNRSYSVQFVNNLRDDLMRRDFIMNTLCINELGEYVDYMGAMNDIDLKIVRCVKDASISFKEDPLRILRAIRFSTTLSFSLSKELCDGLLSTRNLLSNLSFYRRKKELDLIFSSSNCMMGISILRKYGIDEVLSINLKDVKYCSNYLGIWAQSFCGSNYPFTAKEREIINKICYVLSQRPAFNILYEYGMEICGFVDEINQNQVYHEMDKSIPIHKREDICVDKAFLYSVVPFSLISTIYRKIEHEILHGNLMNVRENIEQYILENI